jgi:thiol-disulfide isomerase/thioredoxin
VQIGEKSDFRTADPYRDADVVDARAPRTNQTVVAVLCLVSLVTGAWWLASLMGLQLAIGLLLGRQYCLPCVFYFEVIQPRLGEGPIEDARPPRFANILGAVFLGAATAAHLIGWHTAGWVIIAMVAALATLAAVSGLCVGCTIYRVVARVRGVKAATHEHVDLAGLGIAPSAPVIVQFTHPLCTDCRKLESELRDEGRDVVLIDVSKNPELARRYGVTVVPLALEVHPDGTVAQRVA